jgi:hypothetical protein
VKRREALLDEFERSGLSGPAFAALVGVKYQTLAWWVHERRKSRKASKSPGAVASSPAASSLRLVEAVLAGGVNGERRDDAASTAGALQVHLAGGVRIEVGDVAQMKLAVSLLKALGVERPC